MKLAICDDHPLFRQALRAVVQSAVPGATLIEADGAIELESVLRVHRDLDLLLLDLDLPDISGVEVLRDLRLSRPDLSVLVVSACNNPREIRQAIGRGARGFVHKSCSFAGLTEAIRAVMAGQTHLPLELVTPKIQRDKVAHRLALSPRQLEVLELVSEGMTNQEICNELGLSANTVKSHLRAVFEITGASNRTEAARLWAEAWSL